jgi:hypothetical protein
MARKSSRQSKAPRRPPTAPSPRPRPAPGPQAAATARRPAAVATPAAAPPPAESYQYVRRDLRRIAVIAVILFAVIFASQFVLTF